MGGGQYLWATPPGRKLEMWARLSLSIPPIKKKNITEVNIYIVLILLNHVYILYMGEVFLSCKNLKHVPLYIYNNKICSNQLTRHN